MEADDELAAVPPAGVAVLLPEGEFARSFTCVGGGSGAELASPEAGKSLRISLPAFCAAGAAASEAAPLVVAPGAGAAVTAAGSVAPAAASECGVGAFGGGGSPFFTVSTVT